MKNIFISIIIVNMTVLWGTSYEMLIQVSSGNDDINLTIGVNPEANNWYDAQFDIPAPPLPPSDDDFDARILNDYFPYDFYTDIRSDSNSVQSFHIAYQSSNNISLNWNNTDDCQCYIEDLNNLIQQDMCNVDSLSIEDFELLEDELLITCPVEGIIEGCMDGSACNYNSTATYDDSSCEYPEEYYDCEGECLNDEDGDDVCDEIELSINVELRPTNYSISSIYPNPFNPITNITYSLPENGNIKLNIYNIHGRQIETLVNDFQMAGYHSLNWDASSYSSGVYLISMLNGKITQTQKVVLVK